MQTADENEYVIEEFRPIRHDLLAAGLHAETGDPHRVAGDPRLLAWLRVDGERIGVLAFDEVAAPAERLSTLAGFTQDLVVENVFTDGRSFTWPRCLDRSHRHPMVVVLDDGRALWRCPRDAGLAVSIGELGA
ncbi:hypothetical protein [Amycolatopsis sp. Hca4]|uniref:hypothetical protein n=1 Tax=Amycolatopsis sp. Hca4 TaxID=2742131 RepID=UPI0015916951|nr:hypothetical protein [Amycolatopsis sp. Hca4]QKV73838.1 hypothetical protein HUT10_08680 [Amycolatopsis sp. Hca4]